MELSTDTWNSLARQIFTKPRSPLDGWENEWKKSTIVERLNRDRIAIAVRSSPNRYSMAESRPRSSERVQWWIEITINPRSWPNRGAIVADSRCDRGSFEEKLWLNSWPIRKPRRRPKEHLPRRPQMAPTTASIAHEFGLIFRFKNPCILPLFFNF